MCTGDDVLDLLSEINLETGEVKYKGPGRGKSIAVFHFCRALSLYIYLWLNL